MHKHTSHIGLAGLIVAGLSMIGASAATLTIPGGVSDGVLLISTNTVAPNISISGTNAVLDLSMAVTGTWDTNAVHAGLGVYDPSKWAVVFKYGSVTIAPGMRLSFKNHPSRAPVVWLVQGDVTIDGMVSLNGGDHLPSPQLSEPGPGGFRGGMAYYADGAGRSAGMGPGGGGIISGGNGAAGSYGTIGGGGGHATYGNSSVIPLIGGSGGSAAHHWGGGAGGGAILIASSSTVTINGTLQANGGGGVAWHTTSGSGSGGAIRLAAATLDGNGHVTAIGGSVAHVGGLGLISIERNSVKGSLKFVPEPSVVPHVAGATPLIWLPPNGPTVRVVSINGVEVPSDPRASFGAYGPDVAVPQATSAFVLVETINVETNSKVRVRLTPRTEVNFTEVEVANPERITTEPLVLRWLAEIPVTGGYSAVQVRVQRP